MVSELEHYKAGEPPRSWLPRFVETAFLFVMVHYLAWFWAMVGVLVLLWYCSLWWLALGLAAWYMVTFVDNSHMNGGREWRAFRTSRLWHAAHRYLGLEIVRTAKLDPERRYIFGYHPHGILILSRIAHYGGIFERLFPGVSVRVLGATPMFYLPGARDICLWMCAVDASKSSAVRCLSKGYSLKVYPGGSKEIFTTDPASNVTRLVLKNRKGFVKLAMQHGCDLVPVFVFGEKWLYQKREPPRWLYRTVLKVLRIPLILFWGRWFTWMPFRRRLAVVYGAPIRVEGKTEHVKQEELDALHARYMQAVKDLFETHKAKFGYSAEETVEFV